MKLKLLLLLMLIPSLSVAQKTTPNISQGPSEVVQLNYKFVPSIKEQIRTGIFIYGNPVTDKQKMGRPKLRHGNKVVPGKGSKGPDILADAQMRASKIQTRPPSVVFTATTSTSTPSDPTGAAGINYYIGSWNTSWQIFNKDGSVAAGMPNPASLATLFGEAPGDPIVLYDVAANRYILTQFSSNPNGFHVAISQTSDPINSGWHVYSSSDFQTSAFPDYTKFSIWSDAYYVTANISNGNGQVWAIEREKMLAGNTTASIQAFFLPGLTTSGFYSPQVFNVTDDNLPSAGNATIVYMQDDAWAGINEDHLKLWNLNIDWVTPSNSSISAATELPVTPFVGVFDGGGFSNLSQPTGGPDIDCMQATIMNQAQFRKYTSYNSAVFNFVVDAGAEGNELAAIRWYELRQTGDNQPWTIFQEGTYVAPEGRHAWGASMAMDASGNIGMGYTTMGGTNNTFITSAYTGQFSGAASGVMNAMEEFIQTSTAGNSNLRYADYSHLTLDPVDDATFWFDTELFTPNRSNVIGAFQLTIPEPNDVGVSSIINPNDGVLSATETITIDIRNFGTEDQSNFPVSYSIDGGTIVQETFTGTIAAGDTESFTFATTADLSVTNQTYTIIAETLLSGDTMTSNNETTKSVTNSLQYCIPEATSGCNLDGIKRFVLGDIDTDDGGNGCNGNGNGYVDRRDLNTDLDRGGSFNPYTLQGQHNWISGADLEILSAWIDFNDDGTFEESERLISGESFSVAGSLESFELNLPTYAALGIHVLRVKAIDGSASGDILDPCSNFAYGEVHDYTVNIIDSALSIEDFDLSESQLDIYTKPNNQFEIILTSSHVDDFTFSVHNILGQQIVFNVIEKSNDGTYKYDLDMSYASGGIYIIKIGRGRDFKSHKIIVK